jgi:hypothetical protein
MFSQTSNIFDILIRHLPRPSRVIDTLNIMHGAMDVDDIFGDLQPCLQNIAQNEFGCVMVLKNSRHLSITDFWKNMCTCDWMLPDTMFTVFAHLDKAAWITVDDNFKTMQRTDSIGFQVPYAMDRLTLALDDFVARFLCDMGMGDLISNDKMRDADAVRMIFGGVNITLSLFIKIDGVFYPDPIVGTFKMFPGLMIVDRTDI